MVLAVTVATIIAPRAHELGEVRQPSPVHAELLDALTAVGADWAQLDEPALVSESIEVPRDVVLATTKRAYEMLDAAVLRPQTLIAAHLGSLGEGDSARWRPLAHFGRPKTCARRVQRLAEAR